MADTPTSPCMVAHHETEKNRFYYVNYGAILFNKIALSENVQMGISTDNLGMGLSAILKGVYQVRAIGSGTTLPPSVFTHTVPANMTVGKSYQVAFSGVTSAKGAVTYTVALPINQGGTLVFSKATGILADENITIDANTGVPGNYSFEVRAYAGQTLVATNTVNFTLAAASVAVNVSEVFKTTLYDGNTSAVTITNGVNMRDYNGLSIFKSLGSAPAVATMGDLNSNQYIGLSETSSAVSVNGMLAVERLADGYRVHNASGALNSAGQRYVNWAFRQHTEFVQTGVRDHSTGAATTINLSLPSVGAAILVNKNGGPRYFICQGMNDYQVLSLDESVIVANGSAGTPLWSMSGSTLTLGANFPTGTYEVVAFNNGSGANAIIKCGTFTALPTSPVVVDLGFEPGWFMYREIDMPAVDGWKIIDDVRGMEGSNHQLGFEAVAENATVPFIEPSPSGFAVAAANSYSRPATKYAYIAIKKDPNAVTAPTIGGNILTANWPSSVRSGESFTTSLSGITVASGTGTLTYSISSLPSGFTASKTSGITAGESITIYAAAGLPNGSVTITFSCDSVPPSSNGAQGVNRTIMVEAAVAAPTMSGTISHNIPSTVTAGSNYSVRFGGKSATSGTVLYSVNINSGSQYATFTKTSGIDAGETIYLSVASNAPNSGTISGTISANTSPVGASNGPDSVGFSLGTLAIVEPDPSFSGFSHTVPANTQQGQSYTVTFSGTSSSNGRQVWYSLSPQSGLSFSKLDNISPGEAVTMTVSGSASGTLGVSVYANTTKNSGSTFTQSLAYIQTAVAVPVTLNTQHLTVNVSMVTPSPLGANTVNQSTLALKVSGATWSDSINRPVFVSLTDDYFNNLGQTSKVPQGTAFNFVPNGGQSNSNYPEYLILFTDSAGNTIGWESLPWQLNLENGRFEYLHPSKLPLTVSH